MNSFSFTDISPDKKVIAVDLHGTLLDQEWSVSDPIVPQLTGLMKSLKTAYDFYICTGNNRLFVEQHVPAEIRKIFTGYILETGAVFSNKDTEEIIIDRTAVETIKDLENKLHKSRLPEVLFFGHRLASISLFTKYKKEGKDPRRLCSKISQMLPQLGCYDKLLVTHSDVAVDIVYKKVSKYSGLRRVAGSRPIIAIADSLNDFELLKNADHSFVPANSFDFENYTGSNKVFCLKDVTDFGKYRDDEKHYKTLYRTKTAHTNGLLEVLKKIYDQER